MAVEITLLAQLLTTTLRSMKWNVRRRQGQDSTRHDLIVTDTNGKVFLIEFKGGDENEPTHFGTIAQLERAAHQLSEEEGETITPVLLTTQDVRPTISDLADEVGVQVVAASASESEEQAAETVVQRLGATQ